MKGKVTSASDRRNQKQCLDTLSEMCAKHRGGHLGKRSVRAEDRSESIQQTSVELLGTTP